MAGNSNEGFWKEPFGLSAALTTPFREDLSIDLELMTAHARGLLEEGCSTITLFGTTGEGASLSARERTDVLRAFAAAGFDPARLVVAIFGTAVESALDQALEALDAGIGTLLVPPPYYFKGVSDDGLYSWYADLLDRVAPLASRVLLYHIPQLTAIGVSLALVRRLKQRYGDVIFGVKDSAGHWPTTESFLAENGLCVLVGDERHLAKAVRLGGGGAISGMANILPTELAELVRSGQENARMDRMVDAVVRLPVTPAVKALVGAKSGEGGWARVRAPLEATPAADVETLKQMLDRLAEQRAA